MDQNRQEGAAAHLGSETLGGVGQDTREALGNSGEKIIGVSGRSVRFRRDGWGN